VGYRLESLDIRIKGRVVEAFLYRANPTHVDSSLLPMHWYKDLVVEGARFHGFPTDYIRQLEQVAAVPDPNAQRAERNCKLLGQIRGHRS
jgi:hypothetical protein